MSALHIAEPPAQYQVRPPIVVDCSALAGIVFREPWGEQAAQQLEARSLHAPWLLQVEIASVAVKKLRRGEEHAAYGLGLAAEMAIDLHAVDPVAVADLAQRYQLSAYDASYLWLAEQLRCPLATFDAQLGEAATTHLAALD
jgi:predicted nucleic acid-binding protein